MGEGAQLPGIPNRPARVLIEQVGPAVDGGRHAVKRTQGDRLEVGADLLTDGHTRVDGRIRFRGPGMDRAASAPLTYRYEPDRWYGEIPLDGVGRWSFHVEAWPDFWRTWRDELRKRVDADQERDVALELAEGAAMLRAAAEARRTGAGRLRAAALELEDEGVAAMERAARVLTPPYEDLLTGPLRPEDLSRSPAYPVFVDRPRARFGAWYELFPRSQAEEPGRHGTFLDVMRRLPDLADLGFDVLYLPPIHPIGHTHRKGRNNAPVPELGDLGSPWAIGSEEGGHTAVHPRLGTLEDFEALVREAREHGIEIALDYALQCSPDHPWVRKHPDWFRTRSDGSIRHAENPPKKYEDIVPLDFWCRDREALWRACAEILFFWIERGVRIFRVDNPHTKPFAFWEWALHAVRDRHPDVIFLSEAFTRPKRMKALAKLGFTQSYTYFTWKNESWELREYLTELTRTDVREYLRPNFFANTPDILHAYLQRGGRPAFRVRLLLAATLSPTYGLYSGFELGENEPLRPFSEEYLDSEKYQIRQRDWRAPGSLRPQIRLLNHLRRDHPALQQLENLVFLDSSNEHLLPYWKSAPGDDLILVVNLNPFGPEEGMIRIPAGALGLPEEHPYPVRDLLTGETYHWRGEWNYVRLDPELRPGHLLQVVREEHP